MPQIFGHESMSSLNQRMTTSLPYKRQQGESAWHKRDAILRRLKPELGLFVLHSGAETIDDSAS